MHVTFQVPGIHETDQQVRESHREERPERDRADNGAGPPPTGHHRRNGVATLFRVGSFSLPVNRVCPSLGRSDGPAGAFVCVTS